MLPGDDAPRRPRGHGLVPVGRWLSSDALPPRCSMAAEPGGMLPELDRISSVSGGSITAGVLALHWDDLDFDGTGVAQAFESQLVEPIRRMAGVGVDVAAILTGLGLPFTSISDRVVKAYRNTSSARQRCKTCPTGRDPSSTPPTWSPGS